MVKVYPTRKKVLYEKDSEAVYMSFHFGAK